VLRLGESQSLILDQSVVYFWFRVLDHSFAVEVGARRSKYRRVYFFRPQPRTSDLKYQNLWPESKCESRWGGTSLQEAILGHNLAAIQALLRLGANPELKDCDGASALMMAAAVPSIAAMMGLKLVPKDQVPSNMLHHQHPEPKILSHKPMSLNQHEYN